MVARAESFDVFGLSAIALAIDALLIGGLAYAMFHNMRGDGWFAALLVTGSAAAAHSSRRSGLGAASTRAVARGRAVSGDRALDALMRSRFAAGVVPAEGAAPAHDERPWPVVLLTAFGAWLAALPLIGLAAHRADVLKHGVGAYIPGALVLAGVIAALRRHAARPLFVEQLVVPALIVGAALLGWGFFRDLPPAAGCVVLALVATRVRRRDPAAVAARRPRRRRCDAARPGLGTKKKKGAKRSSPSGWPGILTPGCG